MAFLTTCPSCGNPHVCSLPAAADLRFKCRRCRSEYPAVRVGVLAARRPRRFAEEDTLAEAEPDAPAAGPTTLVVVRQLPSLYPKSRRRKRRRRRQRPPVELVAAALLATPGPVAPVDPAPAEPEPVIATPPAPAPQPLPKPVPKPTPRRRARPPEDEPDESLLHPGPVAVAAVLLVAAALLMAAVAPTAGFVRPLAVLGLLTGLYATGSAFWKCRRLTVPGWTAGLAAGTLLVSFAAPGLLGPRYRAATNPPPPASVQVIPHLYFAGDPGIRLNEWVDAGKASLRQGNVQVQVTHVWIGPPPKPKTGADPAARDRLLCVRLLVQRFRSGPELTAAKPGPIVTDLGTVTLTDPSGRTQVPQPGPPWELAGEESPVADTFETTLLFAVPPSHPRFLRLELTGPAWGGPAALRFHVPGQLIRYAPPRS